MSNAITIVHYDIIKDVQNKKLESKKNLPIKFSRVLKYLETDFFFLSSTQYFFNQICRIKYFTYVLANVSRNTTYCYFIEACTRITEFI